jgi:hypothetical protein
MPETIEITPEFEQLLQSMLAVPEPDPAFIDLQRSQFLSRASLPLKETKMKSRTLRFSPRLAWGLALLALLALIVAAFSTPTLVNALRRLLGYVPGVGVVEQTTTLRVLAAPVIITRAGVALTIEQAVAQPDKTVIVYRYVLDTASLDRPAPADAGSLPSFMADPALRLPDGTELKILAGLHEPETLSDAERAAGKSAVRYRMEFKPLPATVDHVTLLLPRLVPIAPGAGPEFWEIPLDFKPSTGAGLPVIEVAATDTQQPAPTALVTTPTPQVDQDVAFVLDNVVPLPDGYIFMGHTQWTLRAPVTAMWYGVHPELVTVTDAGGQDIPWFDYVTPQHDEAPGRLSWAVQVQGKDFHWPLTITSTALWGDISLGASKDSPSYFEFDPGPRAQPGQSWTLDKHFLVGGYNTDISSVSMVADPDSAGYHYEFTMNSADGAVGVALVDLDHFDQMGGGGGGGTLPDPGPFIGTVSYADQAPPPGPIHIGIMDVSMVLRGSWQVSWAPPAP